MQYCLTCCKDFTKVSLSQHVNFNLRDFLFQYTQFLQKVRIREHLSLMLISSGKRDLKNKTAHF